MKRKRIVLWASLVVVAVVVALVATVPDRLAWLFCAVGSSLERGTVAEARDPLAGRWHAQIPVDDGSTADLFLDLGRLDGRWIGECDFEAFGLSDFNLRMTVRDSALHLDFGRADVSFDGVRTGSPARVSGVLRRENGPIDLVFTRVGDEQLSAELLRFERASADSARLLSLGRNGNELRAAFNRDRSKTRLVVLLSPT